MDYRERALELLESGKNHKSVSKLLKVGVTTLRAWQKRKASGRLAAEYPKVRGGYKVDDEKLKAYVAQHPDAYQSEIAQAIGSKATSVCEALKRLGITRKKRLRNTENGTKQSAQPMPKR